MMNNDDMYEHEAEEVGGGGSRSYEHENRSRARRKLYLFTGICLLVVVIIVIISVVLATKSSGGSSSSSELQNGSGYNKAALADLIRSAYSDAGLDPTPLTTPSSPSALALEWLSSDKLVTSEPTVLLQRFALATFYIATYSVANTYVTSPQPWTSNNLWLSDQSECGWEGVLCSPRGTVLGISLEDHGISGGLPMELALIRDHLTTLDLSSNLIYMQGTQLDVFAKLSNMATFLMDDNYLTTTNTGLPSQLAGLTNLQMIRLSYNLLQGPLDGSLLAGLTKLTHLEVESNFISGSMPSQVGSLSSLIYFYFRRNNMKFNLDFLKSGQMTNLFAMWLDDNDIYGTLPSQLGVLSNLASLSLTNSTINGTIPTQFGSLTNMQRMWLYSNQLQGTIPTQLANLSSLSVLEVQHNHLSGTMPPSLCPILAASTYAKKSLACDCNNNVVTCSCCTSCY